LRAHAIVLTRAFALAYAGLTLHGASIASADDSANAPLRLVLARTGTSALVLWNASPLVAEIVAKRVPEREANDRLERGALRAAAQDLPLLPTAKSITVRVLYDKTGDVSPVYGGPTFAGVERYALLRLDAARARRDEGRWKELDSGHPVPAWIAFHVIGSLPPR
jgi:hypothetical protein